MKVWGRLFIAREVRLLVNLLYRRLSMRRLNSQRDYAEISNEAAFICPISSKAEHSYRHEVVDRQLAHAHKDKVSSAYDRAQFLSERKKMMQEWADYLDAVSGDESVTSRKFLRSA